MLGIYIMAIIAAALSAVLWGGMIYAFSGRRTRYLWLLLLGLPLSWSVNNYLKAPVALFIGQIVGIPPGLGAARPAWFTFVLFMLTPILEELIKVVPLLLPGATDSRFLREEGIITYDFCPFRLTEKEMLRIHGNNERIAIENLRFGMKMMVEILKEVAT